MHRYEVGKRSMCLGSGEWLGQRKPEEWSGMKTRKTSCDLIAVGDESLEA